MTSIPILGAGGRKELVQLGQILISIVTVCFNSEKTIEETIKSIAIQKQKFIEYVVFDGGSTDSTLKIIKKYKKKGVIDKWVSEKDKGIYDAMNKAVKLCRGEYVYFLNSDDVLYDALVLKDVFKALDTNPDFVYGDVEFFYPSEDQKVRITRTASIRELKNGNMPPHQGSFVKRKLLQENPFDISYRSSSDFDFFCRIMLKGATGIKVNRLIAQMKMGGMSSGKISYFETEKIVGKHFGLIAQLMLAVKHAFFNFVKNILVRAALLKWWHRRIKERGL